MNQIFVRGIEVGTSKYLVETIYFKPFDENEGLSAEIIATGFLTEKIPPEPARITGKRACIYYNSNVDTFTYEYVDRDLTPEEVQEQRFSEIESAIPAILGGAV